MSVAVLQKAGGQATEEPDLAVERLVERSPEMFMDPAEEESARKVALKESVTDAVAPVSYTHLTLPTKRIV